MPNSLPFLSCSLEEVEVVEMEEILTTTINLAHPENKTAHEQGTFEDSPVTIMFNSGVSCDVVRPGLVKNMTQSGVSQVTGLNAYSTKARSIKKRRWDHLIESISISQFTSYGMVIGTCP